MAEYTRPLQRYIDAGIQVLVECRQCGHIAVFDAPGLAQRWGARIDPAFLRFRCYAPRPSDGRPCGSTNARIGPVWPSGVVELRRPTRPPPK